MGLLTVPPFGEMGREAPWTAGAASIVPVDSFSSNTVQRLYVSMVLRIFVTPMKRGRDAAIVGSAAVTRGT
jgi:hypothetical protein